MALYRSSKGRGSVLTWEGARASERSETVFFVDALERKKQKTSDVVGKNFTLLPIFDFAQKTSPSDSREKRK
jgi:hypothetical protein